MVTRCNFPTARLRALRVLKREAKSAFIFVSERRAPFTCTGHLPAGAILSAVDILPSRFPTRSSKDPPSCWTGRGGLSRVKGHARVPWLSVALLIRADEFCIGQHVTLHYSLDLRFRRAS